MVFVWGKQSTLLSVDDMDVFKINGDDDVPKS